MDELFDHVLSVIRSMDGGRDFQPAPIIPQKRPTSVPLPLLEGVPVTLLVEMRLATVMTRAGRPAKRQPPPYAPGDPAYAKLKPNGQVHIVPFERAGSGYEMESDAEEGVHYAFDQARKT
jgi:hypothetical protein